MIASFLFFVKQSVKEKYKVIISAFPLYILTQLIKKMSKNKVCLIGLKFSMRTGTHDGHKPPWLYPFMHRTTNRNCLRHLLDFGTRGQ
jgi:hypothetical protein